MTRPPADDDFTELVHVAWPSLYRTALLLVGDHGLAEDLVQSSLAKTYASWSKVRSREAAPAYARAVMVNTATSWFRRRSWRNERPTEVLPDRGHETDPSLRPTLDHALDALPLRQRAVVVLRFYDDLSVTEVASVMRCSDGTVKSQTSAALAKMRALLGDDAVPPHPTTSGAHRG